MTPLDKDFYEGIFNMKRKDKKNIEPIPNPQEQPGKLLTTYQELMDTMLSSYTYSAEPKEITFPAYKSASEESRPMPFIKEFIELGNAMFKTYLEKRTPSIKEEYVLEIVKCFTKAFEEVYSNECPLELVNLCKEYVGNFVKSLDGSTKM